MRKARPVLQLADRRARRHGPCFARVGHSKGPRTPGGQAPTSPTVVCPMFLTREGYGIEVEVERRLDAA